MIYKIIKQVISMLGMVGDPIYRAVYPQFAEMIADHDNRGAVKYTLKIGYFLLLAAGIPALLLGLTSFWWLGAVFGKGFEAGALPLNVFLFLKVFSIAAITIHPLFTAMGYVKQNTIIIFLSNALYLILGWNLGHALGILGLAIAYGFQFSTVVGFKAIYIFRNGLKERPISPS